MSELRQEEVQRTNVSVMNAQKVQPDDEMEIDLLELFQVLLQKAWVIILCMVIGAGLAFGGTKMLLTPKYSASSQIYILTKTTSVTSLADIQMGAQLTVDFEVLAKSRPVVEEVIDELNLDYTYEELVEMITTQNPSDTRILKMTVENEDPNLAKEIANAMAEVTAERVAYIMTTDKPKIVEEAVTPEKPSSPSTVKNTALGGILGAVLAMGIIVIIYLMNDTIQTEEDVRKYLDLNTLAALPLEKRH
ncbi:YveK family protein [Fusicatenibacter saccharivorans]|uniref:YveK family protein n=1 Tax=Fusicatenibacter saccharivorans TaxID=1150298 RepID=UPI003D07DD5C